MNRVSMNGPQPMKGLITTLVYSVGSTTAKRLRHFFFKVDWKKMHDFEVKMPKPKYAPPRLDG